MKTRRCPGVLVRNDRRKSVVTELYVCMWCGATYDAGTGKTVGMRCANRLNCAIRGNPFEGDLIPVRRGDCAPAVSVRVVERIRGSAPTRKAEPERGSMRAGSATLKSGVRP